VALAVRNAARLHAQYPEQWDALVKGEKRPADVVCSFATEQWEPTGTFWQTARHFGTECSYDTTSMPLLLRDFRAGGRGWNSFDWDGHYRPAQFVLNGPKWQDFPSSWLDNPPGLTFDQGRWRMYYSGSPGSSFGINVSISHATALLPNGIPTFWKVVQIINKYYGKMSARERIQLIVREDMTGPDLDVGHMSYQYSIPFKYLGDHWKTMIASADFTIMCGAPNPGRWTAQFITGEDPRTAFPPGIRIGAERMSMSAPEYSVTETLAALTPIWSRLTACKQTLDLHEILGEPFFANPPKELIDLVA
jgi:hypothetical protein